MIKFLGTALGIAGPLIKLYVDRKTDPLRIHRGIIDRRVREREKLERAIKSGNVAHLNDRVRRSRLELRRLKKVDR